MVVQVPPVAVADVAAAGRRWRLAGIAGQPTLHVVVEELLAPQQSGERLPGDQRLVGGDGRGNHRGVERVRLGLARGDVGSKPSPRSMGATLGSIGSTSTAGCGTPTSRTLITVDPPAGTVTV